MSTSDIRAQIQDPLVLLDPACLAEALLDWLPVLERVLGPAEAAGGSHVDPPGDDGWGGEVCSEPAEPFRAFKETAEHISEDEEKEHSDLGGEEDQKLAASTWSPPEPVGLAPPKPLQADLLSDLTQLATLYAELSCFRKLQTAQGLGCTAFLRRYFFLLDDERVRRMCLLAYQEQPELQGSFMEAMLGKKLLLFTQQLQGNVRLSRDRLSLHRCDPVQQGGGGHPSRKPAQVPAQPERAAAVDCTSSAGSLAQVGARVSPCPPLDKLEPGR